MQEAMSGRPKAGEANPEVSPRRPGPISDHVNAIRAKEAGNIAHPSSGQNTSTSRGGGGTSKGSPSKRFFSPKKKSFGYTKWPPLLSPSSPDSDDYCEVRFELERSGHNLTSVLMNPRESLLDGLWDDYFGPGEPAISAVVLPPIPMEMVTAFMHETKALMDRYRQNHDISLKQTAMKAEEGSNKVEKNLEQCFAMVPSIFFKSQFRLEDPEIFDATVANASPDDEEILNQYLDVVETCLLTQISSRSKHFFEALTNLQDLKERVSAACRQVHDLRTGIRAIEQKTVLGAMMIPRLAQRKINLVLLQQKLQLIEEVRKSKDVVHSLLAAEDYMAALDILEDAQNLISGSLSGVFCLKRLERQISEYLDIVVELMGASFISLAMQLRGDHSRFEEYERAPSPEAINGATAAMILPRVRGLLRLTKLSHVLERYRVRLVENVQVIVKTIVSEYLEMEPVGEEPQSISEKGTEMQWFSTRLKGLTPSAFRECLQLCFEQLLMSIERAATVHNFLGEQLEEELSIAIKKQLSAVEDGQDKDNGIETVKEDEDFSFDLTRAKDADGEGSPNHGGSESVLSPQRKGRTIPPEAFVSPSNKFRAFLAQRKKETSCWRKVVKEEDNLKVLELQACKRLNSECLQNLCQLAQRSISQLLSVRKEIHMKLPMEEMKELWNHTFRFLDAVKKFSGSAEFGLKSTLVTQTKHFLEHVHDSSMAKLAATLESEKWNQADVSIEKQREIDKLTGGKTALGKLAETIGKRSGSWNDEDSLGLTSAESDAATTEVVTVRKKKEPSDVIVEGSHFKVVWSALLLVEMVISYMELAASFPCLSLDIVQKTSELLRLFNARATKLVLGAEAIHTAARLRSITAKHLALASQCLSLLMVLMPHVRAGLASHLDARQHSFLVDLDRIVAEYSEHQDKIMAKCVAIVGDLIVSCANASLADTDWDSLGASSCRFIEELIKGVSTMHKVLAQYLPPSQLQDIFCRIFDLLTHRLSEYFDDIHPATAAGRQRLADEIAHLSTSLSMLRGVRTENLRLEPYFRLK